MDNSHYGNFGVNNKPITVKVDQFFQNDTSTAVNAPRLSDVPPRTINMPEIDTSLTLKVRKKEQPDVLLALAREKITH